VKVAMERLWMSIRDSSAVALSALFKSANLGVSSARRRIGGLYGLENSLVSVLEHGGTVPPYLLSGDVPLR
jgi:hypothetical protein